MLTSERLCMDSLRQAMDAEKLIEQLNLAPHHEGGYFRRTYMAKMDVSISKDREKASENDPSSGLSRSIMTSILYLLTSDRPTVYLHFNRSDIIHYYHLGSAVAYTVIHQNGDIERVTLGPKILAGEQLQVTVEGGCWKCAAMADKSEGFSLISEAVAPGFHYDDNILANEDDIRTRFPHLWDAIKHYVFKKD